jgi:hypothetical protein
MTAPFKYKDLVHFMSGGKVVSLPTEVAYKFNRLRKVMYEQWDLLNFKADKGIELGEETAPINIENLGVDLSNLDHIVALLSHTEH